MTNARMYSISINVDRVYQYTAPLRISESSFKVISHDKLDRHFPGSIKCGLKKFLDVNCRYALNVALIFVATGNSCNINYVNT